MSNPKPQPLWELVEKWTHDEHTVWKDGIDVEMCNIDCRRCELAAALRAWDERLKDVFYVGYEDDIFDRAVEGNWVREKLLGVPAKQGEK